MINTKGEILYQSINDSYSGTWVDLINSCPIQRISCVQVSAAGAVSIGMPENIAYTIIVSRWSTNYWTALALPEGVNYKTYRAYRSNNVSNWIEI